jgi:hypothetical protein
VLRPEYISGAPSNIVRAVSGAQAMLDEALRVLSDQESRLRYDESVGLRRSGGGLQPNKGTLATEAGWGPPDYDAVGSEDYAAAPGVLSEMTDILTPSPPRRPGRIIMPDVRWLFARVQAADLRTPASASTRSVPERVRQARSAVQASEATPFAATRLVAHIHRRPRCQHPKGPPWLWTSQGTGQGGP